MKWSWEYYQHPPGEVLATALPVRLRQGAPAEPDKIETWQLSPQISAEALTALQRAPRQKALFNAIEAAGSLSREDCLAQGFSSSILAALAEKGLIERHEIDQTQLNWTTDRVTREEPQTPNVEQLAAIDTIRSSLGQFQCLLLNGVTGSGKTEVYMQAIGAALSTGLQALVLVPEIGLTPQLVSRFQSRFNCPITALHSGLNDNERLRGWWAARSGQSGIILGTRSAVFTALANPGLIIVDEEHDASFKQQDGFRYSARDLAIVRAREESIPVVLGSATPALESLANAQSGRFGNLVLSQRAGGAKTPEIKLLDINESQISEGFSGVLLDLMRSHLDRGNQVLVFLNRRGFAPSLVCDSCGSVFECARCDAQLTVHRSPPGLRCHHCDSQQRLPDTCAACGSSQLHTRGMGTQKSEAFLSNYFGAYPVMRIDRDSTRRKHALDRQLQAIQKGDPAILVGTQMLAKGHHFPKVTLVAVLDADNGLFSADFRGQEHMMQLLFQVAGRAGRAEEPGMVAVQTRHASHTALQGLLANDYAEVARLLLAEREAVAMPPYSHLALFRAESQNLSRSLELLEQIRALCLETLSHLPSNSVDIHRPLPAPMEKRAGKFRTQMMLKATSRGGAAVTIGSRGEPNRRSQDQPQGALVVGCGSPGPHLSKQLHYSG